MNKISRRKFVALGFVAGYGYVFHVEPDWIEVSNTDISILPAGSKNIKIGQLTDFHVTNKQALKRVETAIEKILRVETDLICITGDFITKELYLREEFINCLSQLSKSKKVFATLGNHDGGFWAESTGGQKDSTKVRALIADSGITLVDNQNLLLQINNVNLRLIGVGDLWNRDIKSEQAFKIDAPLQDEVRVLMSHNPDSKALVKNFQWDLMMSGHTHGGQVVIPLINYAPILPVSDKRFVSGLYDWNDRKIFISKGIGNLKGMRFNCRPEVAILNLTAKTASSSVSKREG